MNQTLVSTKYQIVIPKEIRKKANIKPGQKMNVHVAGEQIILTRPTLEEKLNWPQDYYKKLKNPWKGVDPLKYLEEERSSWDE
ncbi:MAG: hypothetical protein A3C30_03780 [Candidatus Levybacteria bacterium RIFCSPHIGHO2_02_FULL_40_18]|nr:MAG: hypothetical protein A2869_00400 [Candidatus Levybacteria bacterium RIFCSPHIGHO2_01_FULL_40_58]OGH26205.1 MAG: hypothetical protein A3C30_03780 [Candidatus Levybacteria bacterium RIFCSPHIGHO2_02_FULL_40_18]OGH31457.1 MAG: hypothetical protein A3E43_02820 [Candidatus Levybacteria bacterium RIFCSPHIGHO2_12_FULL_40_31]OGH40097.1 MAG: hypothetical protein A2894_04140 [Candidatus Levybacteria bacterium RIFCSPLOWO2_01_FULL_40_64]OGH49049.1 MAG: hypothetical protein A3I54_00560 [Candidatus Lev